MSNSKKEKTKKPDKDEEDNQNRLTYTDEVIKDRLGRYGAVFFPSDVRETIDDIIGNERQKERLEDFFKALKKYDEIEEQLKKANLAPNLTVLLYGPPGTGKTTLTRAFAKAYNIPICVVESDRLVSPLLGDTIKNIRQVVDLAADIAKERGAFVLFFDEIDAVGSERSNIHEVGEIKRAVISFLQVIDRINYEGYPLAIVGATNHQHQLDSAIWRRFTFHLSFDFPDYHLRKLIMESFLDKVKKAKIGVDNSIETKLNDEYNKIQKIAHELEAKLGQKATEFHDSLFWKEVENNKNIKGLLKITHGYSGSDIERGTRVALLKAIHTELMTYDIFYRALELVGGTATHLITYNSVDLTTPNENREKKDNNIIRGPPEI